MKEDKIMDAMRKKKVRRRGGEQAEVEVWKSRLEDQGMRPCMVREVYGE